MKQPGQYTGANGREYRWHKWSGGYQHEVYSGSSFCVKGFIASADWPKAKAALDALIEAETAGGVE